ncbi:major capsid protein [Sphingomonas sp.]|uniref:major capsid protein n=1 Tax=Sphingomonas sp. TaxID=28214 RepID=UPI003B3BB27B
MATIGSSFIGIADYYKSTNQNRDIIPVIEALNIVNPLMEDAYMIEANNGTKHLSAIRTGLPSVTWGKLYQGIPQSKSIKQQVEDTTGFVEGLSTVDTRLLEIAKDPAALRMSEAESFLEAMSQEVTTNFFYSDTRTTPERFKGLAARYGALGGDGAGNQIVNAGGVGSDNTSVWFVTWGANQTGLIYPEGTTAGISRQDKGEQRAYDDVNNPYYAKEELFRQHVGVRVGDWRFNARIANIDVSDLQAGTVDLYKFMRAAYYKLQVRRNSKIGNGGMVSAGKTVIYANRTVLEALEALSVNKGSSDNFVRLTPDEIQGREVMTYKGIPIRETDSIINAEALVS